MLSTVKTKLCKNTLTVKNRNNEKLQSEWVRNMVILPASGLFWFVAPQEGKLQYPLCLQKEQVVSQLCVIYNCCSPLDTGRLRLTHKRKWKDVNRQTDRLTVRYTES